MSSSAEQVENQKVDEKSCDPRRGHMASMEMPTEFNRIVIDFPTGDDKK